MRERWPPVAVVDDEGSAFGCSISLSYFAFLAAIGTLSLSWTAHDGQSASLIFYGTTKLHLNNQLFYDDDDDDADDYDDNDDDDDDDDR